MIKLMQDRLGAHWARSAVCSADRPDARVSARVGAFGGARLGVRFDARAQVRPQTLGGTAMFGGGTGMCLDQRGISRTAPQTYFIVTAKQSAALHERSP